MRHARLVRNERGVTLALMAIVHVPDARHGGACDRLRHDEVGKAEAQRAMDAAALAGGSALLISDPAIN